jgi:magnesium transporter
MFYKRCSSSLASHQHPKMEQYGDALFIVVRTAQLEDGRIAFGETHFFVGSGYVVSVRHGASKSYTAVRERCESNQANLKHGEDYILYAILDFIVDNYFPVIEALQQKVEQIEDDVFDSVPRRLNLQHVHSIRRDLLRFRNSVGPLIEVCSRLERFEIPMIDQAMQPLFRDVNDHVRRVQEEIDVLRETLTFAFEASLMAGQSEQTSITRRLAAWAAILAVPTAIAGIYGMNFEHMPELKWRYGYFLILAGILAVCGSLYWRFRRNGWI